MAQHGKQMKHTVSCSVYKNGKACMIIVLVFEKIFFMNSKNPLLPKVFWDFFNPAFKIQALFHVPAYAGLGKKKIATGINSCYCFEN